MDQHSAAPTALNTRSGVQLDPSSTSFESAEPETALIKMQAPTTTWSVRAKVSAFAAFVPVESLEEATKGTSQSASSAVVRKIVNAAETTLPQPHLPRRHGDAAARWT